jgi:hypothetical protein
VLHLLIIPQGELEHRSPKARYKRTSKKEFKQQLAQIERRQARIRGISRKSGARKQSSSELRGFRYVDPAVHHHIGAGENEPLHIGTFCRDHINDPAVAVSFYQDLSQLGAEPDPFAYQNFHMKLRQHLAPRVKAAVMLQSELPADLPGPDFGADANLIFFKNDLVYRHNVLTINYTTYDVRRAQDTVNPRTEHCNIMLLQVADGARHQYRYARVLGIYHANVIYSGRGSGGKVDHRSRRMEFLWVRWFENINNDSVLQGWRKGRFDELRFHRIASKEAFGFVDPGDVLRGCHLIPRFLLGKSRNEEGSKPRSVCAQEHKDWKSYYANRCMQWRCCNACVHSLISHRFVDRDMLMRYHWGLGVGHLYTRIPGLAEPIPAGSPEQLVNDHTGDLHSIPEPDAPGGLAHHPQNEAPQPPPSPTAQLPKNATSAPEKAVSIRGSGIQSHYPSPGGGQQREEMQGREPPAGSVASIHRAELMHHRHARGNGNGPETDDEDDCASINLGDELEDPDVEPAPGGEILGEDTSGDSEEGVWEDMYGGGFDGEPSFSYD